MKTYAGTAKGQRYEMTVEATTTPNGRPGVRLTCSCATHNGTAAAIVATPTGEEAFPRKVIHGYVTMANGPEGNLTARMGKAWKA